MRLIADSGSTKTDWVLTDKGQIVGSWKTQGINPCHQQPEEIRHGAFSFIRRQVAVRYSAFFLWKRLHGRPYTNYDDSVGR